MKKNSPVRIGLVGIGRAGWSMHLAELAGRTDKFVIAAACDILPDRCKAMADRFGCKTYAKIDDLLADPDVELVDIATRSPDHTPHAVLALKAGKFVNIEKPIATSMRQLRQLMRAATTGKGKGKLFIRHNRRFEPMFVHIREIMASGILGDVREVKLRRNGFQRRNDWQTIMGCGGGLLLNWGPHIVDHAIRLLDAPIAQMWADLQRVAALGDAEDHIKLILMGKNGRVVDMEISGGAAMTESEYMVFGTRGALSGQGETLTLRYLNPKQKLARIKAIAATPPQSGPFGNSEKLQWIEETIPVKPKGLAGMEVLWDMMYDSIRNRKPYPIKLEEAMETVRVTCQMKKNTPFEQA
ncbi:MAG: Gfo/Idh/MocA family protein [Phycisphaerales bacterium]